MINPLLDGIQLSIGGLQQADVFGALSKFFIGNHSVFHKQIEVFPFAIKIGAIGFEQFVQFVAHLFTDVLGDFLHIGIALQRTTRYVQRNIGRIDHTFQQHQILWQHVFHIFGNENLVAIQLYAVLTVVDGLIHLRKIQNTR